MHILSISSHNGGMRQRLAGNGGRVELVINGTEPPLPMIADMNALGNELASSGVLPDLLTTETEHALCLA
jgi:hypothetical protein